MNKAALEPLALRDILEVKAGCAGYDHTELPSAAGRSKSKAKSKGENRQGSLFITLTATPTPMAAARAYILRFKSRSARNDLLNGLRIDGQTTKRLLVNPYLTVRTNALLSGRRQ